jgi:hypothetical protein
MGSLFSGPKAPPPPKVETPDPLPTEVDEEILAARKIARRQAGLRRGRSSTILTRPRGLPSLVNQTIKD